ncbi:hypothetical protein EET67_10660 [Pseudaminobacter arsenicus]|uniref:Uncharacterized protein n=1 Tax=Borborobacter arsenicus TaxID=1851146 RepID=A0A432V7C2_9HYPH|nr:hypothetical protein [Pseudaminobacter arsenicus]RUM98058.1 hypothetical protein EET67_10660 [Pseudaminobacter arsenicus]
MSTSAAIVLATDAWESPARIRTVALLFAGGGSIGFPLGLFLARLLAEGRRPETAFAAALLAFAATTIAATGAFYALQYRSYYAEWHAEAFTITWLLQFVFTGLAALYQFAVLGLRLYFPVGFFSLFVAAWWFARQAR